MTDKDELMERLDVVLNKVDDFINHPYTLPCVSESPEVNEYRHALYPKWSKVVFTTIALRTRLTEQEKTIKELREAFNEAYKQTWSMSTAQGAPCTAESANYWKGHNNGSVSALRTIKENYETLLANQALNSKGEGK